MLSTILIVLLILLLIGALPSGVMRLVACSARSLTQPAEPTILDPLTIIPRVFAALGAITAVLASHAVNVLVPALNANAAFVLRLVIAGATLTAVNYVVTKKVTVDSVTAFRSETIQRYRFSNRANSRAVGRDPRY